MSETVKEDPDIHQRRAREADSVCFSQYTFIFLDARKWPSLTLDWKVRKQSGADLDAEDEKYERHVAHVDDEDEAADHGHRRLRAHPHLLVPGGLCTRMQHTDWSQTAHMAAAATIRTSDG